MVKANGLASSCELLCSGELTVCELRRLLEAELEIPARELRLLRAGEAEPRDLEKLKELAVGECVELSFLRRDAEQAWWLELVQEDPQGDYLEAALEWIKKDREVVLMAVRQNGRALAHVDEKLREDKEVGLP